MLESDVLCEFYKYFDNFMKNLGKDEFQQIVDGDVKIGKMLLQVIVVVQYFFDYQDVWNWLMGGGEVKKVDFL